MEDEEVKSSISRRRIMKRAGVGAAIVWSAPVLSSLGAAHAQGATPAPPVTCDCGTDFCSGQTFCGPDRECLCSLLPDGSCFCGSLDRGLGCDEYIACDPDNDACPAGSRCVPTCCFEIIGTGVCKAPCGGVSPPGAGGAGEGGATLQTP